MKKIIPLVVVAFYIIFLVFVLSLSKDKEGGKDFELWPVVESKLIDSDLKKMYIQPEDHLISVAGKSINNFFVGINDRYLKKIVIPGSALPESSLRITKVVLIMWFIAACMLLIFIPLSRSIAKSAMGSRSRWVNFWEALIGFIHDEIITPNFEKKYRKAAMPYFLTVFFFILMANYLGLVPGMKTITGKLGVTLGLALTTLCSMFIIGSIKQGPLWIITGIVPHGIPKFLFPLMWVIELMGLIIKPFALMIRLFITMTGGHIVVVIFLSFVFMFGSIAVGFGGVVGALMITFLEILVGFLQAYIFTALSAMFISSAMHAH